MLKYQDTIPFDVITQFYFEDVVKQLPIALQSLAVDLRVLRQNSAAQQINSLKHLYPDAYLFLPWMLDDIFKMPKEKAWGIGRAHVLLTIATVILDQLVDGQLANIHAAPLIQQQLMLMGNRLLSQFLESPGLFWDQYYACLTEFIESLAIEWDCVSRHTQPYTYETMCRVCIGKAAPLRTMAYALAVSSNNMEPLAVLDPAFNSFLLADQLSDDVLDWREDFQAGRYTLPVVIAVKSTGETLETASNLKVDELQTHLERQGILVLMIERAIALIEETQTSLREANLGQKKWYEFLEERLNIMQRQRRHLYAINFFGSLSGLMTKHKGKI